VLNNIVSVICAAKDHFGPSLPPVHKTIESTDFAEAEFFFSTEFSSSSQKQSGLYKRFVASGVGLRLFFKLSLNDVA